MNKKSLQSLSALRAKIYGHELSESEIDEIIQDICSHNYSDIHVSAFVSACAGGRLSEKEIFYLTKSMIKAGNILTWEEEMVVDKHCIGGIPGNRTTPIIVAIVCAYGLLMPKTSSRAVTSPAGTADSVEVVTNVEFDIKKIKKIVAQERGCMAWGGLALLSPADDILIRIERILDVDSEGQLVASILSKKISAGSNYVLIDIPIGPTAKVRSLETANLLKNYLQNIGGKFGVNVKVIFTDGSQPVGYGIGPALEARDFIAVLKNEKNAPQDLRERALTLAAHIIEFDPKIKKGEGMMIAKNILDSGAAWKKFQSICNAQGGLKEIPQARFCHKILAQENGFITKIDNRHIALVAKLVQAPQYKTAGVDLHVKIGDFVKKNDPLFTIHYENEALLQDVLDYFAQGEKIIYIGSI